MHHNTHPVHKRIWLVHNFILDIGLVWRICPKNVRSPCLSLDVNPVLFELLGKNRILYCRECTNWMKINRSLVKSAKLIALPTMVLSGINFMIPLERWTACKPTIRESQGWINTGSLFLKTMQAARSKQNIQSITEKIEILWLSSEVIMKENGAFCWIQKVLHFAN